MKETTLADVKNVISTLDVLIAANTWNGIRVPNSMPLVIETQGDLIRARRKAQKLHDFMQGELP